MIKILTIYSLLLLSHYTFAQKLLINGGVDTSNVEANKIFKVWQSYLRSKPDSLYDNPYWSKEEKLKYKRFDLLGNVFFKPNLYSLGYRPTLLSIKPVKDGFYEIKTLFSYCEDKGYMGVLALTNHYVKKDENNEYKFYNALFINTQNWNQRKVGSINYIFRSEHKFNKKLAVKMNDFIAGLKKDFNINETKQIDYIISDDFDDFMKLTGFDIYMGMGNMPKTGGFALVENNIIFSGGENEYIPHEAVHIYLNPMFPNAHYTFLEGIANLYGGSMGLTFKDQVKEFNEYLIQHPELDLNDLLSFYYMNNYVNPMYVYGSLFCTMALEAGGIEKLKKLMSYGKEDEDFYKALESELNLKQDNLNNFLREEFKKRAIQK